MENSVLGNALEGVPEESEEEEQPSNSNVESATNLDEKTRDELRVQVYDAMAEKEKTEAVDTNVDKENAVEKSPVKPVNGSASEDKQSSVNGVEETNGVGEHSNGSPGNEPVTEKKVETVKEQNGKEKPEDEESKPEAEQDEEEEEAEGNDDDDEDEDDDDEEGETNGQDKEEEEEVGNLQLAWEMLEVAKFIYKRKESKDEQLMAAQTYLKLGEVSAESGNYPQALEDFGECLTLQLKHLPSHSRLLAETHYHVATTLCYMDQYSQAIQHYNSSIKVIEARLDILQKAIDKATGAEAAAEEKTEMEELKQLLPDIKEKVEDAKESQRTVSTTSQAIQQTLGGASTSTSSAFCENGGPSSSSAFPTASKIPVKSADGASSSKVSNISHLVRKKRKPEEDSPVKDTDAKQAKQEATVNGSADCSASNGKEVKEGKSQEPANGSPSVQSSA